MKKSELRQMIKEVIQENVNWQKSFTLFVKDLEKLSKKYGIAVQSIGGVSYGDIQSIKYTDDLTSGDLEYKVQWKNK